MISCLLALGLPATQPLSTPRPLTHDSILHAFRKSLHHDTSAGHAMGPIVGSPSTDAVDECLELHDKDELEKCVEKAIQILDDAAAPRCHRMKTWILLRSVLGDWDEVWDCYSNAQSMWHIWYCAGENAGTDAAMEEMRVELDALKKALMEEKPAHGFVEEVAEPVAALDAAVQEQKNIDRDAAYETSEEMRKAEQVFLSWSMSLLVLHCQILHRTWSLTRGSRSRSQIVSLSRRTWHVWYQ